MKKVLAFLILCMALALARVMLMVLAVILLLVLVHAFMTRPKETLVFLGTLTLTSLALAQPLACIGGVVVVVMLARFGRWRSRRRSRPVMPTRSFEP